MRIYYCSFFFGRCGGSEAFSRTFAALVGRRIGLLAKAAGKFFLFSPCGGVARMAFYFFSSSFSLLRRKKAAVALL